MNLSILSGHENILYVSGDFIPGIAPKVALIYKIHFDFATNSTPDMSMFGIQLRRRDRRSAWIDKQDAPPIKTCLDAGLSVYARVLRLHSFEYMGEQALSGCVDWWVED